MSDPNYVRIIQEEREKIARQAVAEHRARALQAANAQTASEVPIEVEAANADRMMAAEARGPQHVAETLKSIAKEAPPMAQPVCLYMISDKALGAYVEPRFFMNDAVAFRQYEAEFETSRYVGKPSDFEVHCIGVVDFQTGTMWNNEPRVVLQFEHLVVERTD